MVHYSCPLLIYEMDLPCFVFGANHCYLKGFQYPLNKCWAPSSIKSGTKCSASGPATTGDIGIGPGVDKNTDKYYS